MRRLNIYQSILYIVNAKKAYNVLYVHTTFRSVEIPLIRLLTWILWLAKLHILVPR